MLGGAFPKRHHIDCGVIAIICKVPVLGHYTYPFYFVFVPREASNLSEVRFGDVAVLK
jgi:hypothetical protein